MKNLLTKVRQDRRDPYLGLLEYMNTPIDNIGSPAQLLMSRREQDYKEYRRNRRGLMKSPESSPSTTDISPNTDSPTVRAYEHSLTKETANQAIPFVEKPTTTSHNQEEIDSSEDEIPEPRKTAVYVSRIMLGNNEHILRLDV